MAAPNSANPIHPIAVRRAFGGDEEHPFDVGRIVAAEGDVFTIALADGTSVNVIVNDPRFAEALQRDDLSRRRGNPVVLINRRYRLLGLAVGPAEVPRRLEILYGVVRFENGSAAEIPGEAPQPGWLLFRCESGPAA